MKWNPGMRFHDGVFVNESLYFSHRLFNGLFRYDLMEKRCYFLTYFPKEAISQCGIHRKCIHILHYLVFIPEMGRHIHIYDLNTGKISCISVEKYRQTSHMCTSDAFLWNDKIYIFPVYADEPLLILDIHTWELQTEEEIGKILLKEVEDKDKIALTRLARKGSDVWFAVYQKNVIMRFSLTDMSIQRYELNIPDLFGIYDGVDGFWLHGDSEKEIWLWHPEQGIIKTYLLDCSCTDNVQRSCNYILSMGNDVYALSATDTYIYKLENDVFRQVQMQDDIMFDDADGIKFFKGAVYENCLWIYPFASDALIRIESTGIVAEEMMLPKLNEVMEEEQYETLRRELREQMFDKMKSECQYENENWTLEDYLECI